MFSILIFLNHKIEQNIGLEDNKWESHKSFSWVLGVVGRMKLKWALKHIGCGGRCGCKWPGI
jgi:hypothetical protein